MVDFSVGVNDPVQCTMNEAKRVVAGFCFGTTQLVLQDQPVSDVNTVLAGKVRPKWAYRIYDCIPSSPTEGLDMLEVLMTAGTNSQIYSTPALGILSVLDTLNETLDALPAEVNFWDMDPDLLRHCPPEANPPTLPFLMWKAWCLLDAVDQVGSAIASKVLHHKRPNQFPVLDSLTLAHYPIEAEVWGDICEELQRQSEQFLELEDWFGPVAIIQGGCRLTRLRLHDILLWAGTAQGSWEAAMRHGAPYV